MYQKFVTDWVTQTVKEHYADDIALVVSHTTLRIDEGEPTISYFVPITKRGETLARTFLLGGVGFDIWAISWERLERFAQLEEYNLTCLADGEVLYARTAEDRERFEALQRRLTANLADRAKARSCALRAYEEAIGLYLEMLFASGSDVRLGAGYVLDYLAQAVAFSNGRYFRKSQTDQVNELRSMPEVPQDFCELYQKALFAPDAETQKRLCYDQICKTRDFLTARASAPAETSPREHNFQDLADWYGELSYTWLRIRHYAREKDPVKTYLWGIYLQSELNCVCEDFGLPKIELLEAFDPGQLADFAARADEAERQIRAAITAGGGIIHEYADEKEFLNEIQKCAGHFA